MTLLRRHNHHVPIGLHALALTLDTVDSGHGIGKSQQQRVVDRDYELRFLMGALQVSGNSDQGSLTTPPESQARRH